MNLRHLSQQAHQARLQQCSYLLAGDLARILFRRGAIRPELCKLCSSGLDGQAPVRTLRRSWPSLWRQHRPPRRAGSAAGHAASVELGA